MPITPDRWYSMTIAQPIRCGLDGSVTDGVAPARQPRPSQTRAAAVTAAAMYEFNQSGDYAIIVRLAHAAAQRGGHRTSAIADPSLEILF